MSYPSSSMPKLPPSIDPSAKISTTAIVDEYHPSLGTRVPPTVIEAGAEVGRYAIIYASANIHANASIGDRCTLSPHSVVRSGATLGEGCRILEGAVVGGRGRIPTGGVPVETTIKKGGKDVHVLTSSYLSPTSEARRLPASPR